MPSVVYATKEDVPNFILMNRNLIGQEDFSNRYDAIAFIREDIELASIYEATYSSVVAEYAEWVADDEKYFSDIPQNITFADLVNMDKIEDVPENGEYYCDLLFRHSDYTYLQGKFNVIMADGEFYLLGLTNGFAGTCCYKTLIQPGR